MPLEIVSEKLSSLSNSIAPSVVTWVKDNPKLSTITALAFAALGIAAGASTGILFPTLLSLLAATTSITSFTFSMSLFAIKHSISSPSSTPPQTFSRGGLVTLMNETLDCLKNGHYISPNGTRHTLDLTSAARGLSYFDSAGPAFQRPGSEHTRVCVKDSDCLHAAKELHDKNLNPLVIDMANEHHFGGGYLTGARAQEEDCCRRSGLALAVDTRHGLQSQQHYPLHSRSQTAGLYVPEVPIFRDTASQNYRFLDQPFKAAFGIIAAYNSPPLDNSTGALRLTPHHAHITRERIRTLLHMAHQKGHKSIVLGALGCGAFKNPPAHIAELLFDVIDKEFRNVFKEIVISVIDDHNTGRAHNPEGNFKPFAQKALASGAKVYNAAGAEVRSV